MPNEELLLRLSLLEQRGNQFGEQIQAIGKKALELEVLKSDLNRLEENTEGEILAHVGEGIFVESKIKSKEVLVNIGSKIVVRKSVAEAGKIIDEQINRLEDIKKELGIEFEKINLELGRMIEEAEREGNNE